MLSNNNLKSKTINDYINNILSNSESIENTEEENEIFFTTEKLKHFRNSEIVEIKKALIPIDLQNEVIELVKRVYNNDYEAYFQKIDLYFHMFTLEELTKANILESNLYKSSTTAQKKILRNVRKTIIFHASVFLKIVGLNAEKYCSKSLFNEFKMNKRKEQKFLENAIVVSTQKKVLKLSDCVKRAEQNEAEKLNIIYAIERIAEDRAKEEGRKWSWVFITLTKTGEFHANPKNGNCTYNGVSPYESAKSLNKDITKVHKYLRKEGLKVGIDYLGVSTAESHDDGLLHKHMLVYLAEDNIEKLRRIFYSVFENLAFPGMEKSFVINNGKAKASSYIFKYVMKNINYLSVNLYINDKLEIIKRVVIEDSKIEIKKEDVKKEDLKDMSTIKIKDKISKEDKFYKVEYKEIIVDKSFKNYENMTNEEKDIEALYNGFLNNAFRSYNKIRGFAFFGIENCLTKFRFIARNIDKFKLPYDIKKMFEKNDLYELLTSKFFDSVKIIYVKDNGNYKFLGCEFDNMNHFKDFYKLVKNALTIKKEEIDLYSEIAILNKNATMNIFNKMVLSPNYSSKAVLTDNLSFLMILIKLLEDFDTDKIDFLFILRNPFLFITE
jgi:ABC-type branched-subunit amino acid transport system ATPase component